MDDERCSDHEADYIEVRLRLLPTDDGGRTRPVFTGHRMPWNLRNSAGGEPMLNDASITWLDGVEKVLPGDEARAGLRPLAPLYWKHVQVGMSIALHEGMRQFGEAVVIDRRYGPEKSNG